MLRSDSGKRAPKRARGADDSDVELGLVRTCAVAAAVVSMITEYTTWQTQRTEGAEKNVF